MEKRWEWAQAVLRPGGDALNIVEGLGFNVEPSFPAWSLKSCRSPPGTGKARLPADRQTGSPASGASPHQHAEMGRNGIRKGIQIITAFKRRHHATAAKCVGGIAQGFGRPDEVVGLERKIG